MLRDATRGPSGRYGGTLVAIEIVRKAEPLEVVAVVVARIGVGEVTSER
jgi:hypothetical protein